MTESSIKDKPSIRALVELYRVSKATLERWSKSVDIYDVPAVVKHVLSLRSVPPRWRGIRADRSALDAARLRKINLESDKIEKYMEVLDEQYLPRAEVETAVRRVAAVCDQFDSAIRSELPALLAGLSEAEVEDLAGKFVDGWKAKRADARSEVWVAARAAVERELRGDLRKVAARRQKRDD